MKKSLMAIIIGLCLTGCNSQTPSVQPEKNPEKTDQQENTDYQTNESNSKSNESQTDEVPNHEVELQRYFPKESTKKYFKGSGNEFASEAETVYTKEEDYLFTTVENGGTRILRIYKLTQNGIYIVFEEPEFYESELPELEALKHRFIEQAVLTNPLEKGRVVNGWEIKEIHSTLSVPFGELTDVVVLEKVHPDSGGMTRQYWAPEWGLVKKEFYYEEEIGEEMLVTTELEKVEAAVK